MAQLGQVQAVIVCLRGVSGVQGACANGQVESVAQAYLIDSSQQGIIEASMGPFDYEQGAVVWSAAFSMVVGLYFVSAAIGALLGLIRRG